LHNKGSIEVSGAFSQLFWLHNKLRPHEEVQVGLVLVLGLLNAELVHEVSAFVVVNGVPQLVRQTIRAFVFSDVWVEVLHSSELLHLMLTGDGGDWQFH